MLTIVSAPAPRPDTTRLQRLVHSYRDAAALMAAVELGLFTQVARGADTEAAVARALALSPTNASTDRKPEICAAFAATTPRVQYLAQRERLGWIGNVNALLRAADGDFVFFALHDDPLEPTYVERLVGALETHPRAVLAFADVEAVGRQWTYTRLEGASDRFDRARWILTRDGPWWVPYRGLFRPGRRGRSGACGATSPVSSWPTGRGSCGSHCWASSSASPSRLSTRSGSRAGCRSGGAIRHGKSSG
jgi:hypothetical protein